MTATLTSPKPGAPAPKRVIESHLHPKPSFELADHPMPDSHSEIWRFTPLQRFAPLVAASDEKEDAETGVLVSVEAPAEVEQGWLARGEAPRGTVLVPVDRPSAMTEKVVQKARHIRIPRETQLAAPVHVLVAGTGSDQRSYGHLVIEAGAGSSAVVVLEHVGDARFLGNVEIIVGDDANLTVVSIQSWDSTALHSGFQMARIGRDAEYRHVMMTLGGSLVRVQNNIEYAGPGGNAELYGLYFADGGQHQEHRLFIDQNQPKTRSRVDYRGALKEKGAHTVWIGDVLIRRNAEGIDSYESNKNLVLTDGCRADSVPNLEIETGNIAGAGHSSTTGRFDDEQLFYLRSRGIPEDAARKLVVQGFFFDIIRRIGIDEVETDLRRAINIELGFAADDDADNDGAQGADSAADGAEEEN
jgi:Fe-S cluster assembly protein SufD